MGQTVRSLRAGEPLRSRFREKGRKRRKDLSDLTETGDGGLRNDIAPKLDFVYLPPAQLTNPKRNVRESNPTHVRALMNSISRVGFIDPVLIDENKIILNGVECVVAARALGIETIPCIVATHLSATEKRLVRLALNRLAEQGQWSMDNLKIELTELLKLGVSIQDTAFTVAEFDQITLEDDIEAVERGPLAPPPDTEPIARLGDVFVFDDGHTLICGDATNPETYGHLLVQEKARLILTDEPFNVPIAGHVTKSRHREFVMASGEMSDAEFVAFNTAWMRAAADNLCDGGLLGTFIDWRGYPKVDAAALSLGLKPINLIVWTKTNGGMGSLYRSQHELFPLYKKGSLPHTNNIALGKNGRWRSNVWSYPGASSVSSDSRKGLVQHPTVKPTAMCADAILDLTGRGDIVLDPFLGSGSTLLAAHKTGRRCCGIELDPRYVDVVVRRCQEVYGRTAILKSSGESFDDMARRRRAERNEG